MMAPREAGPGELARRRALFAEHEDLARRLAAGYGRTVRGLELEDVRQEAYVALWMATATWQPGHVNGKQFRNWAFLYIRRRLLELMKRHCRRVDWRQLAEDLEIPDRHAGPDLVAGQEEWLRLLAILPSRRRALIEQVYGQGQPQQQLARAWRVSKQRVSQVLKETLAQLEPHACP